MIGHRRALATVLTMLALAGVGTSPFAAALEVKNTSSYEGAGRWDWTIFINADPATLRRIECVEYRLHRTFRDPVRKVCDQSENKFAYSTNGWGTFTVGVKILYQDGSTEELQHPLVFEKPRTATPLTLTPKNWSREIEPGWWDWGVYIDGEPADLDRIRCVEYSLHRSFADPVRLICSRNDKFELTARGWGTFSVKIKLMLKDGSVKKLAHQLAFGGDGNP